MTRKSITIREDQDRFLDDHHLNFSSWAEAQIEKWREQGKEFPTGRGKRSPPMVRRQITITEELDEFLYEERVNLSHFIQDRLDERMELERKIDELSG